jgi:predicted DNA-binding transcriptional regulator AlpA
LLVLSAIIFSRYRRRDRFVSIPELLSFLSTRRGAVYALLHDGVAFDEEKFAAV